MAAFQTNQCDDDGDTMHEPTVKEIDEIYNFILGGDMRFASASEEEIQRMLLTLDRVSNSINRREEQEEEDKQCADCEIEAKKHCDECGGYGSCDDEEEEGETGCCRTCMAVSGGQIEGCDDCGLLLWNGGGWVKEEEEEPRLIVMRVRKEQQETN